MSKPFVYVGLSQAPGVYELCFVTDEAEVTYHGTLAEFTMLGQAILDSVGAQENRDAEKPHFADA